MASASGTAPKNPVHEDAVWRDRVRNELYADMEAGKTWRQVTEISREKFDQTKYETRYMEKPRDPKDIVFPGDFGHNDFMTTRKIRNPATNPDIPNDRYRHQQTTSNGVGWRKDLLETGLFSPVDNAHRHIPFE
eukprot:gnl/Chilomastix_caulleri/1750.p1 GENE.gnl/Chilomastix_caulleri/1750~~gnl/Chilomastix_caulleri/1750.p1  ORF type:complete len:134 (+),score=23.77 gnl/Chilomastix_caulleri/1750:20-421(+)